MASSSSIVERRPHPYIRGRARCWVLATSVVVVDTKKLPLMLIPSKYGSSHTGPVHNRFPLIVVHDNEMATANV